jgi:ABC-type branched-subunit amino acid transport system substrate-binding protein
LTTASCDTPAPAATETTSPSPTVTVPASPSGSTSGSTLTATAAATPTETASPVELKVVFVLDSTPDGAQERAMPAFQAAELAFASAARDGEGPTVDLVSYDLEGDPARLDDLAADVAEDPGYVAVMIAPFLAGQREVHAEVPLPVVSLSPRDGPSADATSAWRRLVPRIDVQGTAVGDLVASLRIAHRGVCIAPGVPDGSRFGRAVAHVLTTRRTDETPTPDAIAAAACGVVAWTGDATSAGDVLVALGRPRPRMVGGPALRDPTFVAEAGTAAGGTEAICGCADVSTSLRLAAQRFVQDFQSEYGRAPGAGAVEGWDGAHLILDGLRQGGLTSSAFGAWLASQAAFDGLGGTYRFAQDGELANPLQHLWRFRVEGGRWVPAGSVPRVG